MAERKVNLENLVVEKFPHLMGYKRWDTFENYLGNNKYIYIQDIYDLMKEACKQVLELASDNLDCDSCFAYSSERDRYDEQAEAILNTINQIE